MAYVAEFLTPLDVEVLDSERGGQGLNRLLQPLVFRSSRGEVITVEAGYVTDFASIPRIAMWLVPIEGRSAKPAVVHDWLMRNRDKRATRLFNEGLRVTGTPAYRRWLMVAAVAVFTFPDLYLFGEDTGPATA